MLNRVQNFSNLFWNGRGGANSKQKQPRGSNNKGLAKQKQNPLWELSQCKIIISFHCPFCPEKVSSKTIFFTWETRSILAFIIMFFPFAKLFLLLFFRTPFLLLADPRKTFFSRSEFWAPLNLSYGDIFTKLFFYSK